MSVNKIYTSRDSCDVSRIQNGSQYQTSSFFQINLKTKYLQKKYVYCTGNLPHIHFNSEWLFVCSTFYFFFHCIQECPEGLVHEDCFKDIYAKFFPHGSKFSAWIFISLSFCWSPLHSHCQSDHRYSFCLSFIT